MLQPSWHLHAVLPAPAAVFSRAITVHCQQARFNEGTDHSAISASARLSLLRENSPSAHRGAVMREQPLR